MQHLDIRYGKLHLKGGELAARARAISCSCIGYCKVRMAQVIVAADHRCGFFVAIGGLMMTNDTNSNLRPPF